LVDISEAQYQFFIVGGPNNITINNNTFLFDHPKRVGYVEGVVAKLSLSNNIFGEKPQDGVQGFSATSGLGAMQKFFADGVVQGNAFVGLGKSLQTLPNQIYVSNLKDLDGKAVGKNRSDLPSELPATPINTAPNVAQPPSNQQSSDQQISDETTPPGGLPAAVPPVGNAVTSPSVTGNSVTSPNGTPAANSVAAANGSTWALKTSTVKSGWFEVHRDGKQVPAYVTDIQATNDGHVRVKGEDGGWWYWAGQFWTPTQPGFAPEGKVSVDQVRTSDGTVWSLKPSTVRPGLYEVFQNNVQVEAYVYGIQTNGDQIRVIGEDRNWWYRNGQTWTASPSA